MLRELLDLFLTFVRIGGLTFGGGYAMLPMLQREVVENKGWATEEELADYYAIGQCTPGVIAVNTATFIGNKRHGILGGIAATAGVIFPSLVIITLLAPYLGQPSLCRYPRVRVRADLQRRAQALAEVRGRQADACHLCAGAAGNRAAELLSGDFRAAGGSGRHYAQGAVRKGR